MPSAMVVNSTLVLYKAGIRLAENKEESQYQNIVPILTEVLNLFVLFLDFISAQLSALVQNTSNHREVRN